MSETAEKCSSEERWEMRGPTTSFLKRFKADYDRHYAVHCNDHTAAYDGCAEMLEKLAKKGVKTGVLSNKPDEFVVKC